MKALEAEYKGEPYPSRLEARWGIFFDHIGLPVHHEYQGFDLEDGVWYLPDFYIPKWRCYFEAKDAGIWEDESRMATELSKVITKASKLCDQTGYKVILCFGGFRFEDLDPMFVFFPGYNMNILGGFLFGWGFFGSCNGVDVLYLKSMEPDPVAIDAIHMIWDMDDLPKKEQDKMVSSVIEKTGGEQYYRQHLIPLHSSVGFNFSMIKDTKRDCKIFAPFSDPLLCSINASYFNKFKPYYEAHDFARKFSFEKERRAKNANR